MNAKQRPIHPWRWRFIAVWILIFTVLVFIAIRQNRSAISQINHDKASIIQLERTNCALKSFLLQAEKARLKTAHDDKTPAQKQADLAAAAGYHRLARLFPLDGCKYALRGH